jgi:hypothetical protein
MKRDERKRNVLMLSEERAREKSTRIKKSDTSEYGLFISKYPSKWTKSTEFPSTIQSSPSETTFKYTTTSESEK